MQSSGLAELNDFDVIQKYEMVQQLISRSMTFEPHLPWTIT